MSYCTQTRCWQFSPCTLHSSDEFPCTVAEGGARLLDMGWQPLRTFREEHDPDRTTVPTPLPEFLSTKAPSSQPIQVKPVVLPYLKPSEYFAVVVKNIFTPEECQQLINVTNSKGYSPALLNVGRGLQQFVPDMRDGWRCIIDSEDFAKYLFGILQPVLPPTFGNAGHQLSGLNERLRFLYYLPGQAFEAHYDGSYRRPPDHPKAGEASKITVQLYLNDIPVENGGATAFISSRHRIPCQPQAGSALLFSQNLLHEGALVEKGYKYTMRTEAMYRPPK